jgi:hypothetical protein
MTHITNRHTVAWGEWVFLAFLSALIPMMPTDAAGIQMDVIPTFRIEEEWKSNVFATSTKEVSSFGTSVTPGVSLKFTSVDNVMLQVSGNFEKVWYAKSEAKNANSNTWHFRVESTGGWRLTPVFSVNPSVYFINTSNSYRRTQLVPGGDPGIFQGAITNYGNTKSEEFGGGMGFDYLATPNLTFGISGKYSEQRFSDDTAGPSGLSDSTQAGGVASVSYLVSPQTRLGITVGGEHQLHEHNTASNTLSFGLLFGRQFSPGLRVDGTLGVSSIRQMGSEGIPAQKKSTPTGTINASYSGETVKFNAFGSYAYTGGSGFGESTRQWTTGMVFTDQFTREVSGTVSGSYQGSRSVFSSGLVNLTTMIGTAGIRYRVREWASVDLSGSLTRQRSSGQSGETLNNHSGLLAIFLENPYKIF